MHINRHHMTPVSRQGNGLPNNCLRMKVYRHKALHQLFGQMTWLEIARLFTLLEHSPQMAKAMTHTRPWHHLFGDKNLMEAYALMRRVYLAKQKK